MPGPAAEVAPKVRAVSFSSGDSPGSDGGRAPVVRGAYPAKPPPTGSSSSSSSSSSEWTTTPSSHYVTERTETVSPDDDDDAPSRSSKTLWVFDLDGTLLVSHGREIIEVDGMRAGIHPLIEAHVSSALPARRSSDFRYCGEEDLHGDPHELIESAAAIEPVATILRKASADAVSALSNEVAILSARAHDPDWLSDQLTRKFGLSTPIRPDLIQCVYSRKFETEVCDKSTPERKAAALEVLVARSHARAVHFFDDVKANIDFAVAHFAAKAAKNNTEKTRRAPRLFPHLVDFEHAVDALRAAGVEPADVFHPQLRHERHEPSNTLVDMIKRQLSYSNLKELQQLAEVAPPRHVGTDDRAGIGGLAGDGVFPADASTGPEDDDASPSSVSHLGDQPSPASSIASLGNSGSRRRALPP